jgi:hypothetical protein
MKGELNLSRLAVIEEDDGVWFPFSDDPSFSGFELKLRFLDPKTIDRLRKRCLRVDIGKEGIDEEKFFRLATEHSFVGFRGLTVNMLKRLMPLREVRSPGGKVLGDDEEILYSPENALFLRENSYAIRRFISERQLAWERFYEQKREAELKNSASSPGSSKEEG